MGRFSALAEQFLAGRDASARPPEAIAPPQSVASPAHTGCDKSDISDQRVPPPAGELPDPFGPLPPDPADAAGELALRQRLREPRYAAIIARSPGDGSPRSLAIRAAATVWAVDGPEGTARRRAAAWESIPAGLLAGRAFSFAPPDGQPGPGCWVGTPRGNAEVLAWDLARAEALVRLLTRTEWAWVPVDRLTDPVTRPGVRRPKPKGGAR